MGCVLSIFFRDFSVGGKRVLCDFSGTEIYPAQLGPMLIKLLQKRLAISPGLETTRESQCPEYRWYSTLSFISAEDFI